MVFFSSYNFINMTVSEKHEVHIGTSLTISPKCCLVFEPQIMWGGLPSAVSVEHVAVS